MFATTLLVVWAAAFTSASTSTSQTPQFTVMRCEAQPAERLGTVRLPQPVLAKGKLLAAGTYELELTKEVVPPAIGESPNAGCWVQFVAKDAIAGREVATVIPAPRHEYVVQRGSSDRAISRHWSP